LVQRPNNPMAIWARLRRTHGVRFFDSSAGWAAALLGATTLVTVRPEQISEPPNSAGGAVDLALAAIGVLASLVLARALQRSWPTSNVDLDDADAPSHGLGCDADPLADLMDRWGVWPTLWLLPALLLWVIWLSVVVLGEADGRNDQLLS